MYVHGQSARLVRRRFLTGVAAGVMGASQLVWAQSVNPWGEADAIARKVALPSIPARSYPITGFGAVGNGITDCTAAIRRAFNAARAAGGGRVVVPAGNFLTRALSLYSKTGPYLPRFEGMEFEGIDCGPSRQALNALGQPGLPIVGLRLANSSFRKVEKRYSRVQNFAPFVPENVSVNGSPAKYF